MVMKACYSPQTTSCACQNIFLCGLQPSMPCKPSMHPLPDSILSSCLCAFPQLSLIRGARGVDLVCKHTPLAPAPQFLTLSNMCILAHMYQQVIPLLLGSKLDRHSLLESSSTNGNLGNNISSNGNSTGGDGGWSWTGGHGGIYDEEHQPLFSSSSSDLTGDKREFSAGGGDTGMGTRWVTCLLSLVGGSIRRGTPALPRSSRAPPSALTATDGELVQHRGQYFLCT